MERIENGIVHTTIDVSKARMVYSSAMWHIQYKTTSGWFWKTYCTSVNYRQAEQTLKFIVDGGAVTINKYATNQTLEIINE